MRTLGDEVLARAGIYVADADDGESVPSFIITEATQVSQKSDTSTQVLDAHQKETIRKALVNEAVKLLGVRYQFGYEWSDYTKMPEAMDCSELTEACYLINGLKMPDGSQNQFNWTIPTGNPLPGDLGFFGRGGKPEQVYHVGMIAGPLDVIEAIGFDPKASFETGKVIFRPRAKWEAYLPNFLGWRSHPRLI